MTWDAASPTTARLDLTARRSCRAPRWRPRRRDVVLLTPPVYARSLAARSTKSHPDVSDVSYAPDAESSVFIPRMSLIHDRPRIVAGRDAFEIERPESRQHAAAERGRGSGTAGVGDLGEVEVEVVELLQPSSRRRRLTCRRARPGRRRRTRAARPSTSPNGLSQRQSLSSAGRRRKAGARANSVASPMAASIRARILSRGRVLHGPAVPLTP